MIDYRHFDQVSAVEYLCTSHVLNNRTAGKYHTTLRVWFWLELYHVRLLGHWGVDYPVIGL